ncbi:hypothetical protein R3P38DRAFT_3516148 [Favolaschia claudopus]|uniref:PI3K/PI4K catalytic domain-containing protein n=1 Tax=Favolaschia claudopus TaxID=2862362 RepID=A0AAW0BRJ6_9AGAR
MDGPGELWRMRKQFALQLASCSFMTYTLSLTHRTPYRFLLSRTTGQMTMTELVPGLSQQLPIFATNDIVPFRLTPNMQNFLGPIFTEEPEFDLEQQLCLFSRDEVMTCCVAAHQTATMKPVSRSFVGANIDGVVKRAELMACKIERDQAVNNPTAPVLAPVIQTVTNLTSSATNPVQLTKMGEIHPYTSNASTAASDDPANNEDESEFPINLAKTVATRKAAAKRTSREEGDGENAGEEGDDENSDEEEEEED